MTPGLSNHHLTIHFDCAPFYSPPRQLSGRHAGFPPRHFRLVPALCGAPHSGVHGRKENIFCKPKLPHCPRAPPQQQRRTPGEDTQNDGPVHPIERPCPFRGRRYLYPPGPQHSTSQPPDVFPQLSTQPFPDTPNNHRGGFVPPFPPQRAEKHPTLQPHTARKQADTCAARLSPHPRLYPARRGPGWARVSTLDPHTVSKDESGISLRDPSVQ